VATAPLTFPCIFDAIANLSLNEKNQHKTPQQH
jgi:hypothetical protein